MRQQILGHLRQNIVIYFAMTVLFMLGTAAGGLAVKTLPEEQTRELTGYLHLCFDSLTQPDSSLAPQIGAAVKSNVKAIVLMWLLGFTIIGIPFVLAIVFVRGLIIGFTVGFLVNEYVLRGLLFAVAAVLPHNFLALPAIMVTAAAAIRFSWLLLKGRQYSKIRLWPAAAGYSVLCLAALGAMLAAAAVEVYISPVFMKLTAALLLKK